MFSERREVVAIWLRTSEGCSKNTAPGPAPVLLQLGPTRHSHTVILQSLNHTAHSRWRCQNHRCGDVPSASRMRGMWRPDSRLPRLENLTEATHKAIPRRDFTRNKVKAKRPKRFRADLAARYFRSTENLQMVQKCPKIVRGYAPRGDPPPDFPTHIKYVSRKHPAQA